MHINYLQFIYKQTYGHKDSTITDNIANTSSGESDSDTDNVNDPDLEVETRSSLEDCSIHKHPKSLDLSIQSEIPIHSQQMTRSASKDMSAKGSHASMESEWFLHPSVDELVSQQVLLMQEEEDV